MDFLVYRRGTQEGSKWGLIRLSACSLSRPQVIRPCRTLMSLLKKGKKCLGWWL